MSKAFVLTPDGGLEETLHQFDISISSWMPGKSERAKAVQAKWDARKRRMALNKKLEQGIETPKRGRL